MSAIKHCQREGCLKTAVYGDKESPASVCHDHRRAGMYCARDGKLWVATQDGKGTRLSATAVNAWQPKSSTSTQRPSTQVSRGCRSSSLPSTAGLPTASSAETRRPQKTARDTHTAAVTCIGGKRSRAPSRKSLEATGQVEDDNAQLMTREKRQEEMRRRAAQKEERRAAAAAGLKRGQRLEELISIASAGSLGDIHMSSSSADNGGDTIKEVWRKLTPAETLQEVPTLRTAVNTNDDTSRNCLPTNALKRCIRANGKKRILARDNAGRSAKASISRTESKKARVFWHGIVSEWQQKGGQSLVGAGDYRDIPICAFSDCKRPATFGVPGTVVRYCGFHRIFGMEEIIDSSSSRQPVHRGRQQNDCFGNVSTESIAVHAAFRSMTQRAS